MKVTNTTSNNYELARSLSVSRHHQNLERPLSVRFGSSVWRWSSASQPTPLFFFSVYHACLSSPTTSGLATRSLCTWIRIYIILLSTHWRRLGFLVLERGGSICKIQPSLGCIFISLTKFNGWKWRNIDALEGLLNFPLERMFTWKLTILLSLHIVTK